MPIQRRHRASSAPLASKSGHLELGGIPLDSERVIRPSALHAQLLAVLARRRESTISLLIMRRHMRYALFVVAATTLRAVYEYEGMVRSSSLASSLQPPRRLGCAVDDATFGRRERRPLGTPAARTRSSFAGRTTEPARSSRPSSARRGRKAIGSQTPTPSSRHSYVAPMAWGA